MSRRNWFERQPGSEHDGFSRDWDARQTRQGAVDNQRFREGNGQNDFRRFTGTRDSKGGPVGNDPNNVMKQNDGPPPSTPSLWNRFRRRFGGD
jgi:hypothetical protein